MSGGNVGPFVPTVNPLAAGVDVPPPSPRVAREFNSCVIIVGPPGCGKTTLALGIVRQHLEAYPNGIVFAHDPMRQYRAAKCQPYESVDAWRDAARKATDGGPPIPRGASITGGDAASVTRLALDIGKRSNTASSVRVPIRVVYDEGSLLGSSGSTFMGQLDNELLATRRHVGVGPVFNLQQPSQLTARFFEFSTDVIVFRQTRDRARDLEGLLLLERGELVAAGVDTLPRYRYIRVRIGEGISAEPMR